MHVGTLMGRPLPQVHLGFARAIEDLGLQYDMLSYEEIEQGQLKDYRLPLMPASAALSPAEAAAIRTFVEKGGTIIADTTPGMFDHHGRLLGKGLLDDLLGIQRSGLPKGGATGVAWTDGAAKRTLPFPVYDTGLRASGATPLAGGGKDVPCVTVRQAGQGQAVLLNFRIEGYNDLRSRGLGDGTRELMAGLLRQSGIRGPVQLDAGGKRPKACETVVFRDGTIDYVCLLADDNVRDAKPQKVTVGFERGARDVYDVRAGRSLGHTAKVVTTLEPADPKLFALLPYRVERLDVRPVSKRVRPGGTLAWRARIKTSTGDLAGRHCVRVQLAGPDGRPMPHYARNILTAKPEIEASVDLAVNDPAGRWTVRVTDVATGQSASAVVVVGDRE